MQLISTARKVGRLLRQRGIRGLWQKFGHWRSDSRELRGFGRWIESNRIDLEELRTEIERLDSPPLISIILPVYDVDEKWLRLCIDSVVNQPYPNWELCIADDCSPKPHIRTVISEYAAKDRRIKVVFRKENGHISVASNSALELAAGEFVVLLDHDDEISLDALLWLAREIHSHPEADLIYSDEDKSDEKGRRFGPTFKPDWSPDLFYSLNLINHLSAFRTKIVRKIGGFRVGFEGSQDYDLALRFIEEIDESRIRHIPRILYHWRSIEGSIARSGEAKPYAHERARDSIRSHFDRIGVSAVVRESVGNYHRVTYDIPEPSPLVSLFLIMREAGRKSTTTLEQIRSLTDYDKLEIIDVLGTVNLAAGLNKAISLSTGSVLCFVDTCSMPVADGWLSELLGFAIQADIGCAGGKVINEDGECVAGGLVIGGESLVSVAHGGFGSERGGNLNRNLVISNFSAVSLSAMALRREAFDGAGGFNAENLPNHFLDADLCLRLREQGYRVVHTPYAEFITNSGRLRNLMENPTKAERDYFISRWGHIIENDPFHNPNLTKKDGSFSIKF